MKIVVTGFRDWKNKGVVFSALSYWDRISGYRLQVGVGDCLTGGDDFARQWIRANGRQEDCKVFCAGEGDFADLPAAYVSSWTKHKNYAGPLRNKIMIDEWKPLVVLAFLHPDSKGAVGCAAYARTQGIQVVDEWEGRDADRSGAEEAGRLERRTGP